MAESSNAHIVQSLLVNVAIALTKAAAAVFTGSGAMLAEALHSGADCGNQVLLLIGVRHARRAPDAEHPLGYGRALYFWSFLVALLLFVGGGVFSIHEGVEKICNPEPVTHVPVGVAVLLVGLVLEGSATISNVREMNRRRGNVPFLRYLRETKDSDLIVVFGENSADVFGLILSITALLLARVTGDARWDGAGSIAIGVVLVGVAGFLAREVQSLLVGESAAPEIAIVARELALASPSIDHVLNVITVQQGPGEVLVAIKLGFDPKLAIEDVCRAINEYEAQLRGRCPEVRWCFVEPDIPRPSLMP